MSDASSTNCSNFSKQLITETVQAVLKYLEKDNPFPPSVLNTAETARFLHISPSFLACIRAKGLGPPHVKIGSAIRYRIVDLEGWLGRRVTKPANESQKI